MGDAMTTAALALTWTLVLHSPGITAAIGGYADESACQADGQRVERAQAERGDEIKWECREARYQ